VLLALESPLEDSMEKLFNAFLELNAITLLRVKCVVAALENKGVLTKADVDALQSSISDAEAEKALETVRGLFKSAFAN
jgi:hypothetical protein